ncbi:MAG: hypothetical protein WCX96_02570 [Bacilli bacterium]
MNLCENKANKKEKEIKPVKYIGFGFPEDVIKNVQVLNLYSRNYVTAMFKEHQALKDEQAQKDIDEKELLLEINGFANGATDIRNEAMTLTDELFKLLKKYNINDKKAIQTLLILWQYTYQQVFFNESWSIDKSVQSFDEWCSFIIDTTPLPLSPATRTRLAFRGSRMSLTDSDGKKLDSSKQIIKRYYNTYNNTKK